MWRTRLTAQLWVPITLTIMIRNIYARARGTRREATQSDTHTHALARVEAERSIYRN